MLHNVVLSNAKNLGGYRRDLTALACSASVAALREACSDAQCQTII